MLVFYLLLVHVAKVEGSVFGFVTPLTEQVKFWLGQTAMPTLPTV